ncbi:MFS transporter [Streptomyces spectabilis]|uniref:MFS transporter n=1 Tax=Streptomyces spectabilis TaxID=68270 RepID=UPI0033D17522
MPHPWATLLAVSLGTVTVTLDSTAVAIANPSIAADLNVGLSALEWVTNSYLLVLALTLIPAGAVADRCGHKWVFMAGVLGFSLSSLAIGLSPDAGWLIAFRAEQGACGALLQPSALGLLRAAFPGGRLGTALGVWGMALSASTAAGPVVAGFLVEAGGWRSVFFLNLPVGAAACAIGLVALRGAPTGAGRSPARPGARRGGRGRAGHGPRPALFPVALFRSAALSAGVALTLLTSLVMTGTLFYFTLYLQGVRGLSATQTGVRLLPLTLAMIVMSPLAGRAVTRVSHRVPAVAGLAVTAFAFLGLAAHGCGADAWASAPWLALLGAGLAPVLIVTTDAVVGGAPGRWAGFASGVQQTAMQLGAVLGILLLGPVLTAVAGSGLPDALPARAAAAPATVRASFEHGLRAVLVIAAAVTATAGVLGCALRTPKTHTRKTRHDTTPEFTAHPGRPSGEPHSESRES